MESATSLVKAIGIRRKSYVKNKGIEIIYQVIIKNLVSTIFLFFAYCLSSQDLVSGLGPRFSYHIFCVH